MGIYEKIALTSMMLSFLGATVGGVAEIDSILGKIANVVALVAGIVSIVAMSIMIWGSIVAMLIIRWIS